MDELLAALGMNNLGGNTFGTPLTPAPPGPGATQAPPIPPAAMASAAPQAGPGDPEAGMAGGVQPSGFDPNTFLKTLQGVKAPTAPTPQKVSTPAVHAPTPIHGGNLLALLQSLGVPSQSPNQGYHLPSTLSGGYLGTLGVR